MGKESFNWADPGYYQLLHQFAIDNKKHQTEAESFLWEHIRGKKLGKKFNRQYIIDQYIVDFVCLDVKLVIEVDGGYHSEDLQQEYDALRTERLEALGFIVIRFDNDRIIAEIDKVIKDIIRFL